MFFVRLLVAVPSASDCFRVPSARMQFQTHLRVASTYLFLMISGCSSGTRHVDHDAAYEPLERDAAELSDSTDSATQQADADFATLTDAAQPLDALDGSVMDAAQPLDAPDELKADADIEEELDQDAAPQWHQSEYMERTVDKLGPLFPGVRVMSDGSMVSVFGERSGLTTQELWSVWYQPQTGWALPRRVEPTSASSYPIGSFVTATTAHVVWAVQGAAEGSYVLWYRSLTAGSLGAPQALSKADDKVVLAELVASPGGDQHLLELREVANGSYALHHRTFTAGAWSQPSQVAASLVRGFTFPRTFDSAGDLHTLQVEASAQGERLIALRYHAGVWQAPRFISDWSASGIYDPSLQRVGERLLVTFIQDGEYYAVQCAQQTTACDGRALLSLGAVDSAPEAPLLTAQTASGGVVFVWGEPQPGRGRQIWSRSFVPGQGYGAPGRLSAEVDCSSGSGVPTLYTAPGGESYAAWSTCHPPDFERHDLWASRYDPNKNAWSARQQLSTTVFNAPARPVVIANSRGVTTVAWSTFEHTAAGQVAVNVYTPAGGWTGERIVEQDNVGLPSYLTAFVDHQGTAHLVWEKKPHSARGEIRTSSRKRDGTWTAPLNLSQGLGGYPASHGVDLSIVRVDAKHIMLVWGQYDGQFTDLLTAHHY